MNRRKISKFISAEEFKELRAAADCAAARGFPLRTLLTIRLSGERSDDERCAAWSAVRKRVTIALTRSGVPAMFVWAREPDHLGGDHLHILAHVPQKRLKPLRSAMSKWWRGAGDVDLSVLPAQMPPGRNGRKRSAIGYVAKGISSATAQSTWFAYSPKGAGDLLGKRCGVTSNIGAKARAAAAQANAGATIIPFPRRTAAVAKSLDLAA